MLDASTSTGRGLFAETPRTVCCAVTAGPPGPGPESAALDCFLPGLRSAELPVRLAGADLVPLLFPGRPLAWLALAGGIFAGALVPFAGADLADTALAGAPLVDLAGADLAVAAFAAFADLAAADLPDLFGTALLSADFGDAFEVVFAGPAAGCFAAGAVAATAAVSDEKAGRTMRGLAGADCGRPVAADGRSAAISSSVAERAVSTKTIALVSSGAASARFMADRLTRRYTAQTTTINAAPVP